MGIGINTVYGCYKNMPDLFEYFAPPEDPDYNLYLNAYVYQILMTCQDLEVLYSDPRVFKWSIGVWSAASQPTWDRLYNTLTLEYNPIENYDRQETGTNTVAAEGETSGDSTTNTYVSGFNSGNTTANTPHDKTTGDTNGAYNDSTSTEYTNRVHGNIGVTTSQQMIQQERDIAGFNLIEYIANSFKEHFCLQVY